MGDTRKPIFTFLLKNPGKKPNKVELFKAQFFKCGSHLPKSFRLRVNGKWYSTDRELKYCFLNKWEIRDILWRSLKF